MECDIEGLHCETGPGVWEAALQSQVGIEAADRANLFKTFAKIYFPETRINGHVYGEVVHGLSRTKRSFSFQPMR